MLNAFWLRIFLSFAVAGSLITLGTVLAERLGTKLGGLFANVPSNILVSLFFMGWLQGPAFAAEASRAVPWGMAIDSVFILVFVLALFRGLRTAVITSLGSWILLAFLLGTVQYSTWLLGIALYVLITLASFYLLEHKFHIPAKEKSNKPYSVQQLLLRAAFAGSVVAGTVVIATFFGPYWGGLFATFPAVLLSALAILTITQRPAFAQATGKTLMLASSNILVYAFAVFLTYPTYGLLWGTIISYLAALTWVALLHPVIQRTV